VSFVCFVVQSIPWLRLRRARSIRGFRFLKFDGDTATPVSCSNHARYSAILAGHDFPHHRPPGLGSRPGGLGTRGAAMDANLSDEIIELPKFIVTDSRVLPPPEAWRHAEISRFRNPFERVRRETGRFVRDFEMLQQVVGGSGPPPCWPPGRAHLARALCARQFLRCFSDGRSRPRIARMNSLFLQDRNGRPSSSTSPWRTETRQWRNRGERSLPGVLPPVLFVS